MRQSNALKLLARLGDIFGACMMAALYLSCRRCHYFAKREYIYTELGILEFAIVSMFKKMGSW